MQHNFKYPSMKPLWTAPTCSICQKPQRSESVIKCDNYDITNCWQRTTRMSQTAAEVISSSVNPNHNTLILRLRYTSRYINIHKQTILLSPYSTCCITHVHIVHIVQYSCNFDFIFQIPKRNGWMDVKPRSWRLIDKTVSQHDNSELIRWGRGILCWWLPSLFNAC